MTTQESMFFFDLDGTLTSAELLPLIGDELGLRSELHELTQATMAGHISSAASFRLRVALLGTVPIERVADIVLRAPVHNQLMQWVQANATRCRVVTNNLDVWVDPWLKHHGLEGYCSTAEITEQGAVTIASGGILRKRDVLERYRQHRLVAVGDGANDAEMIEAADFGIANEIVHGVPAQVLAAADAIVMSEEALCTTLSRL